MRVAVASTSPLCAEGGGRVGRAGGNAVDAAIAAALVSATAEPGVCSLGAGAYLTIWPPDGPPVTIDGNVEMPGRGVEPERLGQGGTEVYLEYGGGVSTVVGHASVGTPGALAACGLAAERYGRLPWRELVEPAYEAARDGFPLSQAAYNYLVYSGIPIYGWNRESYDALHDASGRLYEVGETIHVAGLDDTLRQIADEGASVFYRGELARRIAADSVDNDGMLTLADLQAYEPIIRPALDVALDAWHIATNPPPAIGGATLVAMLLLMRGRPHETWTPDEVRHLIEVQRAVLHYRRHRLDLSEQLNKDARALLETANAGRLQDLLTAPSTVHTSAVDASGLGCAVTMSAGYGSGVMPPGTGLWMNNCLGEIELNRRGLNAGPPGTRLTSNMAPTVARRDGAVLAIGSPGADRITTAILQTIVNFVHLERPLEQAIRAPRAHVELTEDDYRVAYEAGLPVDELDVPQRRFAEPSMFFGGVSAALWEPESGFTLGADPRRTGGTVIVEPD